MGSPTQVDQGGLTYVVGGLAVATTPGASPTTIISSTGAVTATMTSTALDVASPSTLTASAANLFTITPTGNVTINATGLTVGRRVVLIVLTSGTNSYTITFGTNFKSTGTLATGTTSGKYFIVEFISDGTNLYEIARTTAM